MSACHRIVVLASILGLGAVLLAQSSTLPPEKQAIEQRYLQERAAGAQNPAPKDPNSPYPIVPEQPFPVGVLEECAAPFSSAEASISNCWAGVINGVKTVVYAGADGSNGDPTQGVVYVVAFPGYPQDVSGSRLPTPIMGGALHVVAAQNGILTLVSETGSYVLTFDVSTRVFTSVVVDNTPPVIAGMPAAGCTLRPPNQRIVHVADITASDDTAVASGGLVVTAFSSQPITSNDPFYPDIIIRSTSSGSYSVDLRADRLGSVAADRIYTVRATATDVVGNVTTTTATCIVPHDQR
jgi:hypothetical protein